MARSTPRLTSALARLRGFALVRLKKINDWDSEATHPSTPTAEDIKAYAAEYKNQRTDVVTGCESTEESRLVSLPAEIRNQIYKNVLVESEPIDVNSSNIPAEPGLLRVNRNIRNEARHFYYNDNLFLFTVYNYDGILLVRWLGSSEFRQHSKWQVHYEGLPNWANLLAWLKATYEENSHGRRPSRSVVKKASEVVGIFNLVARMKSDNVPWHEIEPYLEDVRQIMTYSDPLWGWTVPDE